jgi:hypothetical protein
VIKQSADTQRLLDQMACGRFRAGREAAREIAAKAEAQYGSAWTIAQPRPPEPEPTVTRSTRRPRADHAATATRARTEPGVWRHVGEYGSLPSALATAWVIRMAGGGKPGSGQFYAPAGFFEADVRRTEFGVEVLVRYVGEPAASAEDEAWDDALAALNGGAA